MAVHVDVEWILQRLSEPFVYRPRSFTSWRANKSQKLPNVCHVYVTRYVSFDIVDCVPRLVQRKISAVLVCTVRHVILQWLLFFIMSSVCKTLLVLLVFICKCMYI